MDRMILESYPYRVIEGLAIAAFAIGAKEGSLYVREEYPLALERLGLAIETARERGFLGGEFDLRIVRGAGAFVCGEETAMIASIEGRRGMPTLRPPYPVERGLSRRPTVVNNVETLAVLPWIFREEYEAHLEGRCPAGRCLDLIRYHVKENCTGCTICSQLCPADAIPFTPYERHEIDNQACTACDICRGAGPEDAIEVL